MRELFIYYRAAVESADALQAAVLAMQADLQSRHSGLQTRLLRRPEPTDGLHIWMEIYAFHHEQTPLCRAARPSNEKDDADQRTKGDAQRGDLSIELQQEIEATAHAVLARWLCGPRHTEVFISCAC